MMKKLLLTGFDPFAHYNINPSWEAVSALPDNIGSFAVTRLMLPNIYETAGRLLIEEAERVQPDVILMTGMDSGSTRLHADCVAVNLRDALLEDNKGLMPWGEPVVPGAPAAYFATIPVHKLVTRLQKAGCPVHLGYCTGGYVCNDIFIWRCTISAAPMLKQVLYMCRCFRRWCLTKTLPCRLMKQLKFYGKLLKRCRTY